jgi:hypothetical protein
MPAKLQRDVACKPVQIFVVENNAATTDSQATLCHL